MYKMPEVIEFVSDKVINDKKLYSEIETVLKRIVSTIYTQSLNHSTFCDSLATPGKLTNHLLKVFGVTDRQLSSAFEEIGYFKGNRMYADLYYQTLSVLYYIGVKADDDLMRMYSLVLINIKIFNGRKYRYMPNGCQPEIAEYLINQVFRSSKVLKKHPNPFNAITEYLAPNIENKYNASIKKDPAHPIKGLVMIISQSWNRIDQMFMGVQKEYYKAWNNSDKKGIMSNVKGVDGEEIDRLDSSKVTNMVNKVQKNLITKHNKLGTEDIKYLKASPYGISSLFLTKTEDFLNAPINEDDIHNIYEILFDIVKVVDESKLCAVNIVQVVDKLTGTRSGTGNIKKLKDHIDEILKLIFGKDILKSSVSLLLKLRKVLLLIILLRAKRSVCNKAKFEKTGF
jgi:hypothetical protein